jgi:hypothetical protein
VIKGYRKSHIFARKLGIDGYNLIHHIFAKYWHRLRKISRN